MSPPIELDDEHHHDTAHAVPTSAGLWFLTGLMITALGITGNAANYVRSFWVPVLIVVGLIVVVLSATTLLRGWRAGAFTPMHTIGWLVTVPMLIIIISAPSPLGASMLANSTSGSTPNSTPRVTITQAKNNGTIDYPPLNDTHNELTLEQLSDRFNFDDESKIDGKPITLVGFVSHEDPPPSGANAPVFVLNRFKIYCCAADAISYSTAVIADQNFPDDTWLTVTGHLVPGQSTMVFKADMITPTKQPKRPYL